jgi:hypothetical protein
MYVMTQEEQDLQLGRLCREKREMAAYLGQLKARAAAMGKTLAQLGDALAGRPESIKFVGRSCDMRFENRSAAIDLRSIPAAGDLVALIEEIRAKELELHAVTEQLKRLEI